MHQGHLPSTGSGSYSESSTLALETLNPQLLNCAPLFILATSIGHAYKKQAKQAQLRTQYQTKEKYYKNTLKERLEAMLVERQKHWKQSCG